jgi:Fur family ferric uptake transcriptional regulator
MSHDKLNYLDVLREQGYRLTRQRQVILDAICQAGGHATMGELVHRTRLVEQGIDRSTVYRTINLFVKLGLVNAADDENGERTYEIVQEEHHHHLICKRCGAEIKIENQLVDEFYRDLKAAYEYQVQMDHLIVFGVCAHCKTPSDN